jgi:hypothetical protein
MKIATEFLILHEDGTMPSEEKFCPSLWECEDSEIDGDYYYDDIDGRWTNLSISKNIDESRHTVLEVNVYRENNRNYEPSICEADDLKRYIQYRKEGRYSENKIICKINNLCVTSMCFETCVHDDYEEFLRTVLFFLNFSGGVLVNYGELDGASFEQEFIEC